MVPSSTTIAQPLSETLCCPSLDRNAEPARTQVPNHDVPLAAKARLLASTCAVTSRPSGIPARTLDKENLSYP